MTSKPLHDCAPGELRHAASVPLARTLQHNECRMNCELFDASGDDAHVWRAWRAARAMGDITPECMSLLARRLDVLAAKKANPKRADQRARRNAMLVLYYDLLSRQQGITKADARRRVARHYATKPDIVKQEVLKHERSNRQNFPRKG